MNLTTISRKDFCAILTTSITNIQKNFAKLEDKYFSDVERQREQNIDLITVTQKEDQETRELCSQNTKIHFSDWFQNLVIEGKVKLGAIFNIFPAYGSAQVKYEADNETLALIQNKYQEVHEMNVKLLDECNKKRHTHCNVNREFIVAIHPNAVEDRLKWMLKRVDDSAHGNEGYLSKGEVKSIKTQFKNHPWLESKCPSVFKLL